MDSTTDPLDQPEERDDDGNPWVEIIFSPRKAIRMVLRNDEVVAAVVLAYLAGVEYGLNQAVQKSRGDSESFADIITSSLLLSGIGGLVMYAIGVALLRLVASWFHGTGNYRQTFIVFGWACVPSIVGIFLTLIAYAVFGDELFMSSAPSISNDAFLTFLYQAFYWLKFLLYPWYLVLLVVGLTVAHRLSVLDAFLSLVTSVLTFVGVILLLIFLF